LADLGEFEVFIDNQTDSRAWNSTLDLADRFRLSLYDAAYVELRATACIAASDAR
jgi:hypothetical protein